MCLLFFACAEDSGSDKGSAPATVDAGCDAAEDADGDGLDDCSEAELGTSADRADTDGDGLSDGEEVDCVSDPLDAGEQCYACGWPHGDPGELVATGGAVGDTVANVRLVDQCEEEVELWDFAGGYTVALVTTAWCGSCKSEAADMGNLAAVLSGDTGQTVRGLVLLFQGRDGGPPSAADVVPYADEVHAEGFAVLGDLDSVLLESLPYDGSVLPGVCLLGPKMDIVSCGSGADKLERLTDTIIAHAD